MRTIIVGAGGQLGSALVSELTAAGDEVVALTRQTCDVTDPSCGRMIATLRPDAIVNCTAWNDVDGAEDHPDRAIAVNRDGVQHLAAAAWVSGAALVHYSTDFVFDGAADRPYVETDAPAPLSAYGRSKLAGEEVACGVPMHYVLRLASVFGGRPGEGAGGRGTIDRIVDNVVGGREVRAFVDRTVSPSYTLDVARATRALLAMRAPSGRYHCVGGGCATWFELAQEVVRLTGAVAPLVPVSADSVRLRAARPRFCALSNAKLAAAGIVMPSWRHALRRYLARRLPGGTVLVPPDPTTADGAIARS